MSHRGVFLSEEPCFKKVLKISSIFEQEGIFFPSVQKDLLVFLEPQKPKRFFVVWGKCLQIVSLLPRLGGLERQKTDYFKGKSEITKITQKNILAAAGVISTMIGVMAAVPLFLQERFGFATGLVMLVVGGLVLLTIVFGD